MSRDVFDFRAYTRLKQLQHLLRTRQIDQQFYWTQMMSCAVPEDDRSAGERCAQAAL